MRSRSWTGLLERAGRVALAAAALVLATRASAGLGERADAVAEDRKALGAEAREPIAHDGYAVEQMTSPGHEVREYVSPDGVVFGLAWDGISHPDLSRLLGPYAKEYRRAAAKPGAAGRRHGRVRTGRIVVETWGHMRSLHGRAYAPALVPQGVKIDEIR